MIALSAGAADAYNLPDVKKGVFSEVRDFFLNNMRNPIQNARIRMEIEELSLENFLDSEYLKRGALHLPADLEFLSHSKRLKEECGYLIKINDGNDAADHALLSEIKSFFADIFANENKAIRDFVFGKGFDKPGFFENQDEPETDFRNLFKCVLETTTVLVDTPPRKVASYMIKLMEDVDQSGSGEGGSQIQITSHTEDMLNSAGRHDFLKQVNKGMGWSGSKNKKKVLSMDKFYSLLSSGVPKCLSTSDQLQSCRDDKVALKGLVLVLTVPEKHLTDENRVTEDIVQSCVLCHKNKMSIYTTNPRFTPVVHFGDGGGSDMKSIEFEVPRKIPLVAHLEQKFHDLYVMQHPMEAEFAVKAGSRVGRRPVPLMEDTKYKLVIPPVRQTEEQGLLARVKSSWRVIVAMGAAHEACRAFEQEGHYPYPDVPPNTTRFHTTVVVESQAPAAPQALPLFLLVDKGIRDDYGGYETYKIIAAMFSQSEGVFTPRELDDAVQVKVYEPQVIQGSDNCEKQLKIRASSAESKEIKQQKAMNKVYKFQEQLISYLTAAKPHVQWQDEYIRANYDGDQLLRRAGAIARHPSTHSKHMQFPPIFEDIRACIRQIFNEYMNVIEAPRSQGKILAEALSLLIYSDCTLGKDGDIPMQRTMNKCLLACAHAGKVKGKDLIALVGVTGAGKSTAINILRGVELEKKERDGVTRLILKGTDVSTAFADKDKSMVKANVEFREKHYIVDEDSWYLDVLSGNNVLTNLPEERSVLLSFGDEEVRLSFKFADQSLHEDTGQVVFSAVDGHPPSAPAMVRQPVGLQPNIVKKVKIHYNGAARIGQCNATSETIFAQAFDYNKEDEMCDSDEGDTGQEEEETSEFHPSNFYADGNFALLDTAGTLENRDNDIDMAAQFSVDLAINHAASMRKLVLVVRWEMLSERSFHDVFLKDVRRLSKRFPTVFNPEHSDKKLLLLLVSLFGTKGVGKGGMNVVQIHGALAHKVAATQEKAAITMVNQQRHQHESDLKLFQVLLDACGKVGVRGALSEDSPETRVMFVNIDDQVTFRRDVRSKLMYKPENMETRKYNQARDRPVPCQTAPQQPNYTPNGLKDVYHKALRSEEHELDHGQNIAGYAHNLKQSISRILELKTTIDQHDERVKNIAAEQNGLPKLADLEKLIEELVAKRAEAEMEGPAGIDDRHAPNADGPTDPDDPAIRAKEKKAEEDLAERQEETNALAAELEALEAEVADLQKLNEDDEQTKKEKQADIDRYAEGYATENIFQFTPENGDQKPVGHYVGDMDKDAFDNVREIDYNDPAQWKSEGARTVGEDHGNSMIQQQAYVSKNYPIVETDAMKQFAGDNMDEFKKFFSVVVSIFNVHELTYTHAQRHHLFAGEVQIRLGSTIKDILRTSDTERKNCSSDDAANNHPNVDIPVDLKDDVNYEVAEWEQTAEDKKNKTWTLRLNPMAGSYRMCVIESWRCQFMKVNVQQATGEQRGELVLKFKYHHGVASPTALWGAISELQRDLNSASASGYQAIQDSIRNWLHGLSAYAHVARFSADDFAKWNPREKDIADGLKKSIERLKREIIDDSQRLEAAKGFVNAAVVEMKKPARLVWYTKLPNAVAFSSLRKNHRADIDALNNAIRSRNSELGYKKEQITGKNKQFAHKQANLKYWELKLDEIKTNKMISLELKHRAQVNDMSQRIAEVEQRKLYTVESMVNLDSELSTLRKTTIPGDHQQLRDFALLYRKQFPNEFTEFRKFIEYQIGEDDDTDTGAAGSGGSREDGGRDRGALGGAARGELTHKQYVRRMLEEFKEKFDTEGDSAAKIASQFLEDYSKGLPASSIGEDAADEDKEDDGAGGTGADCPGGRGGPDLDAGSSCQRDGGEDEDAAVGGGGEGKFDFAPNKRTRRAPRKSAEEPKLAQVVRDAASPRAWMMAWDGSRPSVESRRTGSR